MKYLILLFVLSPFTALAEGKVGAAQLAGKDNDLGNRFWFNMYEPVMGKFSMGIYAQHEYGLLTGNNTYGKLSGHYDATEKINIFIFGEAVRWTSKNELRGIVSSRAGLGVEYRLW